MRELFLVSASLLKSVTYSSLCFRKSKIAESQLPEELQVEDDDIITDASSPIPQHALFSAPQSQSQPVGKVFVERSSECRREQTESVDSGVKLNVGLFAFRAIPGCRALGLEEDQRTDGQHGRLAAPAAAVDHQRRFNPSARRLQVKENPPTTREMTFVQQSRGSG